MALGSHLITVRRLKKYIDDVIGKKANLPDTSKTIIGNISQINSDLSASGNCTYLGDITTTTSLTIPTKYKRLGFRIGWGPATIDRSYTEVSKDAMRLIYPMLIESFSDQHYAQLNYNSQTRVLTAQAVASTTGVVEVYGIE